MSILEKLKGSKPTAAQLAERVTAGERALAALTTTLDQAEAEATAVAHDDAAYREALSHVANVKAEQSAAAERLEHLRRAHREAWEREQADFLSRIQKEYDDLVEAQSRIGREGYAARQAEEARHKERLAAIDNLDRNAAEKVSICKRKLGLASGGICETDVVLFFELKDRHRKVAARIHESRLEERLREADSAARQAKENRDSAAGGKNSDELFKRFDSELKAATTLREQLENELRPLKSEASDLRAQMAEIEAKLDGR